MSEDPEAGQKGLFQVGQDTSLVQVAKMGEGGMNGFEMFQGWNWQNLVTDRIWAVRVEEYRGHWPASDFRVVKSLV